MLFYKVIKKIVNGSYNLVFKHVKNQNDEICIEAVKRNGCALEYVIHKTWRIVKSAILQNPNTIMYLDISKDVEVFVQLAQEVLKKN